MGGKARFVAPPSVLLLPIAAQPNASTSVSARVQLAYQIVTTAIRCPTTPLPCAPLCNPHANPNTVEIGASHSLLLS
jgi:hypothetical protein